MAVNENLLDEFRWRGMVHDETEGAGELLATQKVTAYVGFDPTAESLHVGSLLPIMCLLRLQRAGHTPIALVGGGTGMIGDPSGKTVERQLLSREAIAHNVAGIRRQLSRFLDFEARTNAAQLIDNADWLAPVTMLDFLRDVGKHFTVNYMLAKESVKRRLEQADGISFTEFSYMLLQAYDFLVLHDRHGCTLQMGGSDQWGNIVAGVELIRRVRGAHAHGLTFPLVTTAAGVKFGKTEAGTVWLDAARTSPFRFYQFWINTGDRDVLTYLKYFTLLDREAISGLAGELARAPEQREAQKALAREVTARVHGPGELERAIKASQVLFGGEVAGLGAAEVAEIFADVPSNQVSTEQLAGDGLPLVELVASSGLAPSRGEARRLIESGGIYVNNRRVADAKARVTLNSAVEGRFVILRKGGKDYRLVRVGDSVAEPAGR